MNTIETAAREIQPILARRDYTRLRALLTEDFRDHGAPPGSPTGADAYVNTMRWVTETLGIEFELEEAVSDGDLVALRIAARGVHRVPQFGLPATGRLYLMQTMHFYRGRDGKLAEHWGLSDQLGMLLQVGALPPAGTNAPPAGCAGNGSYRAACRFGADTMTKVIPGVLTAAVLFLAACSSSTAPAASPAGSATPTVGGALTAAGAGSAAASPAKTGAAGGITISCTALTATQISAALGGAPSAGQTIARPGGGECDWTAPGTKLQTATTDPADLSLESNPFTGKDSWLEYESSASSAESGNGYAALPDISGDSAYWNPDSPVNLTDEIQLWDGNKEVVLGLVLVPNPADPAARAAVQAALITLAKDLTHS